MLFKRIKIRYWKGLDFSYIDSSRGLPEARKGFKVKCKNDILTMCPSSMIRYDGPPVHCLRLLLGLDIYLRLQGTQAKYSNKVTSTDQLGRRKSRRVLYNIQDVVWYYFCITLTSILHLASLRHSGLLASQGNVMSESLAVSIKHNTMICIDITSRSNSKTALSFLHRVPSGKQLSTR